MRGGCGRRRRRWRWPSSGISPSDGQQSYPLGITAPALKSIIEWRAVETDLLFWESWHFRVNFGAPPHRHSWALDPDLGHPRSVPGSLSESLAGRAERQYLISTCNYVSTHWLFRRAGGGGRRPATHRTKVLRHSAPRTKVNSQGVGKLGHLTCGW